MSLYEHFASLDGFEPADRWKPLELINGWKSWGDQPAMFQKTPEGLVLFTGYIFGGEVGKPQARVPYEYLPKFEDGTDRFVVTWFSTGFTDHQTGYVKEGRIGPRLTIFRNGEVLLEELDAFGGLPLESLPLDMTSYKKT